MTRYLIRRLLQAIPTFLGITLITFVVIRLAPGDPVMQMTFDPKIKAETREKMRRQLGLDRPIAVQYMIWLFGNDWMELFGEEIDEKALTRGVLRLDFGRSYLQKRPATEMILERVPATVQLNIAALLISYAVGLPVGVYSALKQNGVFDNISRVIAVVFNAVPGFWLSLMMILIFAVKFKQWGLPHISMGGMYTVTPNNEFKYNVFDRLKHLLPPALVLATGGIAGISRYMRTEILEVIHQDYVRTARAKGLSERVVAFFHAGRNALIPIATMLGRQITGLLGGAVITETIWSWPGLGRMFIDANFKRDYPVVLAGFVITAIAVILGNLLSDILYAVFDPRIRLS
ncbi:MAG: ABC transporter permease [Anaerolineae bacterium]|nr:ABC transporter permease [Anaerolineae bacterium]